MPSEPPLSFSPQMPEPDLEQALADFSAIQEALNYQQAQESLRHLVNQMDLQPQERQGLEAEINQLEAILEKLDQQLIQIAAFGLVGRGKSSVLNALMGNNQFETGPIHGVTQTEQAADWVALDFGETINLRGWGNGQVQLIDTPGIDEVNGAVREQLAIAIAQQVDLILFVIAGDMSQVELQALTQLRAVGKPMLLVLNKIDQYPDVDRQLIYEKIRDERVKTLLSPGEIVLVSANPLVTEWQRAPDGQLKRHQYRGQPRVEVLREKILTLLQREGKSLVALNTLLCADGLNEKLVQQKLRLRDALANQVIQRSVMIKAVAIALNPATVVDLLSGAVIDVAMIIALSKLYGLTMTQTTAIALLQKIGISMGGISASELVTNVGLSSLKGLLGITIPLTGGLALAPYVSVAVTQAGVAGVSTLAIGQVTKRYLANGASWGEQGPRTVVREILAALDQESIMARIKQELATQFPLERF